MKRPVASSFTKIFSYFMVFYAVSEIITLFQSFKYLSGLIAFLCVALPATRIGFLLCMYFGKRAFYPLYYINLALSLITVIYCLNSAAFSQIMDKVLIVYIGPIIFLCFGIPYGFYVLFSKQFKSYVFERVTDPQANTNTSQKISAKTLSVNDVRQKEDSQDPASIHTRTVSVAHNSKFPSPEDAYRYIMLATSELIRYAYENEHENDIAEGLEDIIENDGDALVVAAVLLCLTVSIPTRSKKLLDDTALMLKAWVISLGFTDTDATIMMEYHDAVSIAIENALEEPDKLMRIGVNMLASSLTFHVMCRDGLHEDNNKQALAMFYLSYLDIIDRELYSGSYQIVV